jgi:thiamine biosynthesis lipoprotein
MCTCLWWRERHTAAGTLFAGETQGTTYSIKVAARLSTEQRHAVETAIRKRLDEIDRTFSLYREDSELARFNRQQTTDPVPLSPMLLEVFKIAQRISEETDGAYDCTVGPLVAAWGFGPAPRVGRQTPADTEIAGLLPKVGYRKIVLDAPAQTARKTAPDLSCDLNGIAQGYSVDRLAEDIAALGYSNYLVEIGGEIRAHGVVADGRCWRTGIENPMDGAKTYQRIIELNDMSLTTAGDYRNFMDKDGLRLSHIIDPRTGRPVDHNLAAVSVLHAQCVMADGYDTALMVLGPEKGYEFAVRKGLAVVFTAHDPKQGFATKTTPAFDAMGKP